MAYNSINKVILMICLIFFLRNAKILNWFKHIGLIELLKRINTVFKLKNPT